MKTPASHASGVHPQNVYRRWWPLLHSSKDAGIALKIQQKRFKKTSPKCLMFNIKMISKSINFAFEIQILQLIHCPVTWIGFDCDLHLSTWETNLFLDKSYSTFIQTTIWPGPHWITIQIQRCIEFLLKVAFRKAHAFRCVSLFVFVGWQPKMCKDCVARMFQERKKSKRRFGDQAYKIICQVRIIWDPR